MQARLPAPMTMRRPWVGMASFVAVLLVVALGHRAAPPSQRVIGAANRLAITGCPARPGKSQPVACPQFPVLFEYAKPSFEYST